MSFLDLASDYFSSGPTAATVLVLLVSLAVFFALFRLEARRPMLRLKLLSVSFAVEVLAWTFVGSSLVFCGAFLGLYASEGDVAVRLVFGLSVLVSVVVAVPLAAFVTLRVPGEIARRLVNDLPQAHDHVAETAERMARDLGVDGVRVLESPDQVPFAYSVGGARSVMVVSEGLLARLDYDEVETVVAHELAHVKNHDTGLTTVMAVCRRVLFFDPVVGLLERAVHSEKEFSADELAARRTGKPLSLASALLKISSAQAGAPVGRVVGLSILGRGVLKPPSVKERVERLISLAKQLEGSPPDRSAA